MQYPHKEMFLWKTYVSRQSDESGKEACAQDGQNAGYDDGKTAHRAFDLSDLQGLARADGVGGCADGDAFGDRLRDMERFEQAFGDDIAQYAGNDDHRCGDGDIAAQFLAHADADGGGDGFGQKGDIGRMIKAEEKGKDENAQKAGQHA